MRVRQKPLKTNERSLPLRLQCFTTQWRGGAVYNSRLFDIRVTAAQGWRDSPIDRHRGVAAVGYCAADRYNVLYANVEVTLHTGALIVEVKVFKR